jgi:rubrerythrin
MTNKTQMNRIEKQLRLYKHYLKICRIEYVANLCKEIVKLEDRLDLFRQMTETEIKNKVAFQYVIVQSKANKLNL